MDKISKTERKIEKGGVKYSAPGQKKETQISDETKIQDVSKYVAKLEWSFDDHTGNKGNRLESGKANKKWTDDPKRLTGKNWMQGA